MDDFIDENTITVQCNGKDCEKTHENPTNIPATHQLWARLDAYGMYTGMFCDECYGDDEKYGYKRDRYFDEAYAGERLEPLD
jgi:Tfp pilus assembly protein PilX